MLTTEQVLKIKSNLRKAYDNGDIAAFNVSALKFLNGIGIKTGYFGNPYKSSVSQETLHDRNNIPQTEIMDAAKIFSDARESQKIWGALPLKNRQRFFSVLQKHMAEHAEHFRLAVTLDMGKADGPAGTEMVKANEWLNWAVSDEVKNALFEVTDNGDRVTIQTRKAAGVAVGMTSANYPLGLFMGPFVSALLTGSTYIYKNGEKAPSCAYIMKEMVRLTMAEIKNDIIMHKAFDGMRENYELFVNGLYSVIEGRAEGLVEKIVTQADFFTFIGGGFGYVVDEWRNKAGKRDKTVLELGGFAPAIIRNSVFEVFGAEALAAQIHTAATDNSGQRCTGVRVIFAETGQAEQEFLPALEAKYLNAQNIGNPFDPETKQGPMIYADGDKIMKEVIAKAVKLGARLVSAGDIRKNNGFENTCLTNGALLVWDAEAVKNPNVLELIKDTELFCPLTHVFAYNKLEQALDVCRKFEFKLAGAIYTNNSTDVEKFAELELGEFCVNLAPKDLSPKAGHGGGVAKSGHGRLGGTDSLIYMTEPGQSRNVPKILATHMIQNEIGLKGKGK